MCVELHGPMCKLEVFGQWHICRSLSNLIVSF